MRILKSKHYIHNSHSLQILIEYMWSLSQNIFNLINKMFFKSISSTLFLGYFIHIWLVHMRVCVVSRCVLILQWWIPCVFIFFAKFFKDYRRDFIWNCIVWSSSSVLIIFLILLRSSLLKFYDCISEQSCLKDNQKTYEKSKEELSC